MGAYQLSPATIVAVTIIVILFLLIHTFMIPFLQEVGLWGKRDLTEEIAEARNLARLLSEAEVRVRKIEINPPLGMLVLYFRASIPEIEEGKLVFPREHLSFERLKELIPLESIRFELLDVPLKEVRPIEAVAYLLLR